MKRLSKIVIIFALMAAMVFAVIGCNDNKVNPGDIQSISITTLPTKTTYKVGDKSDYSGGKITVTKIDGTTEELDFSANGVSISGFDTKTPGDKTLTVTYGGKSDTFNIYVTSGEVGDIKISFAEGDLPRTVFVKGQEFDKRGGRLTVEEGGNTEKIAFESSSITVSGYDKDKLGKQTLTVSYHGATTTLDVYVYEPLEVVDYQSMYYVGEEFNSQGTVWLTENDGSRSSYKLNDNKVTLTFGSSNKFDSSKAGTVTVKVSCAGKEGSFTIEVKNGTVKEIKAPNKTEYTTDDTKLELEGGYIVLNDGSGERQIPLTDEMVSGFDEIKNQVTFEKRDQKVSGKINVKYYDYTGDFDITVSFGDGAYIKHYVAELNEYYDETRDFWIFTEEQEEDYEEYFPIIVDCAEKLVNNPSAANALSEDELKAIVACATFYVSDAWLVEIEPFNGLYLYDEDAGSLVFNCATYAESKASYENLVEYVNYDGSDKNSEYYDLFRYEEIIEGLRTNYGANVMCDFSAFMQGDADAVEDDNLTVEIFLANIFPYINTKDIYSSNFIGMDVAFDLYDIFNDNNITTENMAEKTNKIKEAYDLIAEPINKGLGLVQGGLTDEDNARMMHRSYYSYAVRWYAGVDVLDIEGIERDDEVENTWQAEKSIFDMIYLYAMDTIVALTDQNAINTELTKLAYITTYIQMPHFYEMYYSASQMMSEYFNDISSGILFTFFANYDEYMLYMDDFYTKLSEDEDAQQYLSYLNIVSVDQSSQQTTFSNILNSMYSSGEGYYNLFIGTSYGSEDFEAVLKEYNKFAYQIALEKSAITQLGYENGKEALDKEDYDYIADENGTYSDKYYTDVESIMNKFFKLNSLDTYNFINTIVPIAFLSAAPDVAYSLLAPYYYEGDDQTDAGWYAESPFAEALMMYLAKKNNVEEVKQDAEFPEAFKVAAKTIETYEYYLMFIYGGTDSGVDVKTGLYGKAFNDAYAEIEGKFAGQKEAIKAYIPEIESIYNLITEAHTELNGTRSYTLNTEEQALWDEYESILVNVLTIASNSQYYKSNGINIDAEVLSVGSQYADVLSRILEKIEDGQHQNLRKKFYYGNIPGLFTDTQTGAPVDVGTQFVLNYVSGNYLNAYQQIICGTGFYSRNATETLEDFIGETSEICVNAFMCIGQNDSEFRTNLQNFQNYYNQDEHKDEIMEAAKAFAELDIEDQVNYMNLGNMGTLFRALIYKYAPELGYTDISANNPNNNLVGAFVSVIYAYINREYIKNDENVDASVKAAREKDYQDAISAFETMRDNLKLYYGASEEYTQKIEKFKTEFSELTAKFFPANYDIVNGKQA